MLAETLQARKESIYNELQGKGLADYFARSFLDHIEPNSTMQAYCHKCKEVDKIDFVAFDGNIMYHCNNCDIDIMNLDTQLYHFVHFNVQKKRGEKYVN